MDAQVIDKATEDGRFDWRWPLYGIPAAFLVFLPIQLCQFDTSLFLKLLAIPFLLLVSAMLLITSAFPKKKRQILAMLLTLVIFWATSTAFVLYDHRNRQPTRSFVRWLIWSRSYKAEVLAQPTPTNGDFKHMVWDASGFAGIANTDVYLVFDPTDSLTAPAKDHRIGKFNGIPCTVPLIRRLESHWYTVTFYTDENWGDCVWEKKN